MHTALAVQCKRDRRECIDIPLGKRARSAIAHCSLRLSLSAPLRSANAPSPLRSPLSFHPRVQCAPLSAGCRLPTALRHVRSGGGFALSEGCGDTRAAVRGGARRRCCSLALPKESVFIALQR